MSTPAIKKILVFSHEFPPLGGGGGRLLALLCGELCRRGYEPVVLTAGPPEKIRQQFPFKIVYFPTFRKARFKTSIPAMLLYLVQAVLYCLSGKARGFDLLFSNFFIPAGLAGMAIRRLLGLSQVILHHGAEVMQGRRQGARAPIRWAFRLIAGDAAVNFFVSRGLLGAASSYGPLRGAAVLPNASSICRQSPLLYSEGEKLLLFAGRMEPVKNPLLLIRALGRLRSENGSEGIRCLMVGGGSMYRRVAREIERAGLQRIIALEPAAPFERMQVLYGSAYALALPSIVEGYPTTVLEAGAFGVPAIASDTIGNSDAIVHEKTGLLFRLNDEKECADSLHRLASDPALRNRLGQAAFNRSREFTIERAADAFIDALSISSEFSTETEKMRKK